MSEYRIAFAFVTKGIKQEMLCSGLGHLHRKVANCKRIPRSASLQAWYGRAPRKLRQKRVALVPQVLDPDLAGEKAVRGKVAQEREKVDRVPQALVLCRVLSIGNEIEYLLLLFRRAVQVCLAIIGSYTSRRATSVRRQHRLVVIILAREKIDKLRCPCLHCAAGVGIRRQNRLAQALQRLVLMRIEELRNVSAGFSSAFSCSMTWCACSAASRGMTRSTDPATIPVLSDFNTLRRETRSMA